MCVHFDLNQTSPSFHLILCDFLKKPIRQTVKYLEFLAQSDPKRNDSIFDFDPSFSANPSSGDIVYKILGIEPDETMTRAPSIIISKKVRQNQEADAFDEEKADALGPPDELEKLKNLLQQEDSRDDVPNHKNAMKRISSSSKSLLNKKFTSIKLMNTEHDDKNVMHESQSDISLYKPASKRDSAVETGLNVVKKVKRPQAKLHPRPTPDGAGMTTLLARSTMSMMAAPSLESIAENSDPTAPSSLKPMLRSDIANSMTSLHSKKHLHGPHHHVENKLNISVGDSIIDLKGTAEDNLSCGVSMSSIVISETSSEDDDGSELGDEVVIIDADTISM